MSTANLNPIDKLIVSILVIVNIGGGLLFFCSISRDFPIYYYNPIVASIKAYIINK
jgi:hypothetical protein